MKPDETRILEKGEYHLWYSQKQKSLIYGFGYGKHKFTVSFNTYDGKSVNFDKYIEAPPSSFYKKDDGEIVEITEVSKSTKLSSNFDDFQYLGVGKYHHNK